MSALEGLRRQIEATNTAVGMLLQGLEDVKSRVTALESRSAQSTTAPVVQAPRAATPPAQTPGKSTSTSTPAATASNLKSASGKS